MKKIIFLVWFLLSIFSLSVNAEYVIYTDMSEFEAAKWDICESATDGCNTYFMTDWKVMWWTKMYCENHTPEWSCTKYKENTITTMSEIQTTTSINTDEQKVCTMEYAPVCAQVQVQCIKAPCNPMLQTFSNTCMAWENKIVYKWECNTKISDSDIELYNSIKTSKLENKYQEKVNKLIENFNLTLSKYDNVKKEKLYTIMLNKVEKYINDISLSYPMDKEMTKMDNLKYLMLKLLKFELLINQNN